MKLLTGVLLIAGVLVYTGNIKSFDDLQDALQDAHRVFLEDSALLELSNTNDIPALSDNEIRQFELSLEPYNTLHCEDIYEKDISDPSSLTPSPSAEYITSQPAYNTIFVSPETYSAFAHIALRKSSASALKVQKINRQKVYACDYPGCIYKTPRSYNLDRHKYIHTNEKPYACDHSKCNYTTYDMSHLRSHKQTHSLIKPHICDHPTCSFTTSRKAGLTAHKKNKHPRALDQESSENKRQRRQ